MNQLQVVEQKLVNFNGAEIMGVKTNDEKVRIGVRWVCEGIGLTLGQYQGQTRKIQEDLVLYQGVANLQLPTNGGMQEVLTIELDFLPLWLAKITITPTMQKESPEVTRNLVNYQLKAKDVLAEAFVKGIQPKSQSELIAMIAQDNVERDKVIKTIKSDVNYLMDNMRLSKSEETQIQRAGKAKVIQSLGGIESNAYRKIGPRVFPRMWGDFKRHFTLPRYSELPKVQFEEGLEFINEWTPSTSLRLEIRELNNQQHLQLVD